MDEAAAVTPPRAKTRVLPSPAVSPLGGGGGAQALLHSDFHKRRRALMPPAVTPEKKISAVEELNFEAAWEQREPQLRPEVVDAPEDKPTLIDAFFVAPLPTPATSVLTRLVRRADEFAETAAVDGPFVDPTITAATVAEPPTPLDLSPVRVEVTPAPSPPRRPPPARPDNVLHPLVESAFFDAWTQSRHRLTTCLHNAFASSLLAALQATRRVELWEVAVATKQDVIKTEAKLRTMMNNTCGALLAAWIAQGRPRLAPSNYVPTIVNSAFERKPITDAAMGFHSVDAMWVERLRRPPPEAPVEATGVDSTAGEPHIPLLRYRKWQQQETRAQQQAPLETSPTSPGVGDSRAAVLLRLGDEPLPRTSEVLMRGAPMAVRVSKALSHSRPTSRVTTPASSPARTIGLRVGPRDASSPSRVAALASATGSSVSMNNDTTASAVPATAAPVVDSPHSFSSVTWVAAGPQAAPPTKAPTALATPATTTTTNIPQPAQAAPPQKAAQAWGTSSDEEETPLKATLRPVPTSPEPTPSSPRRKVPEPPSIAGTSAAVSTPPREVVLAAASSPDFTVDTATTTTQDPSPIADPSPRPQPAAEESDHEEETSPSQMRGRRLGPSDILLHAHDRAATATGHPSAAKRTESGERDHNEEEVATDDLTLSDNDDDDDDVNDMLP